MRLLDCLGEESLDREYKEFCLKVNSTPSVPYDEIKHIIQTGTITNALQDLINDSLAKTIVRVFPKYYASFANANLNGTLYIGVNDHGIITGIPSTAMTTTQFIQDCINKAFINLTTPKETILASTELDIVPLTVTKSTKQSPLYKLGTTIQSRLTQYEQQKAANDQASQDYTARHAAWLTRKSRYNCKLTRLVNEPSTRQELRRFILDHLATVDKTGLATVKSIVKRLKTTETIPVPCGIKLIPYKSTLTCPRMDSIYYWLLKFQNTNLESLQAIKPYKPNRSRLHHPWLALRCLRDMIPAFTQAKVVYYLLKISIKPPMSTIQSIHSSRPVQPVGKKDTSSAHPVSFHLSKKRKRHHISKWTCKKRVLSDGQPACVDV